MFFSARAKERKKENRQPKGGMGAPLSCDRDKFFSAARRPSQLALSQLGTDTRDHCAAARMGTSKKQKEAKSIVKQLRKPSYWDEVGPRKPNASALKAALADTVLVDAAWLARLADEGGILPRCQDLPPGARVTLEEMEKWEDMMFGTLGVLVISYPWWAPLALDPLQ